MGLRDRDGGQIAASGMTGLLPIRLAIFGGSAAIVAIIATVLTRSLVPPAPSPLHQLVMVKNLVLPIVELLIYAVIVMRMEHRPASEIKPDRDGARLFSLGISQGRRLSAQW